MPPWLQQSGATNPPHEWMNWGSLAVIIWYRHCICCACAWDRCFPSLPQGPHSGSPAPQSCSIKELVAMLGSWNIPLSHVPLLIYLIRRTGCPWFITACGEPVAARRGEGAILVACGHVRQGGRSSIVRRPFHRQHRQRHTHIYIHTVM
jgi:hypothetical protein